MWRVLIVLAGLLAVACSSAESSNEDAVSEATFLRRCQTQAASFGFVAAGESEFESVQDLIKEGNQAELTDNQLLVVAALEETVSFGPAEFTPDRTTSVVTPGETSLVGFREGVGMGEYIDFMRTIGFGIGFEDGSQQSTLFTDQLLMACDSRQEEFLSEACAAGDSEACRLVDNLDQLDPAIVAEACELTPYMLFCDPEDPIPWELPPLDDE